METNQVNQVIEALKPLADKFGQGAQQFFDLAVRQVYISAIQNMLWVPFFVWAAFKTYNWAKNDETDEMVRAMAGIGFLVSVALTIVCISCSITDWVNPHYAAISNILEMVVPKSK